MFVIPTYTQTLPSCIVLCLRNTGSATNREGTLEASQPATEVALGAVFKDPEHPDELNLIVNLAVKRVKITSNGRDNPNAERTVAQFINMAHSVQGPSAEDGGVQVYEILVEDLMNREIDGGPFEFISPADVTLICTRDLRRTPNEAAYKAIQAISTVHYHAEASPDKALETRQLKGS